MAWQMAIMQGFMVKKGLITDDELQSLLNESESEMMDLEMHQQESPPTPTQTTEKPKQNSRGKSKKRSETQKLPGNDLSSTSEVTIYCRAVRQLAPQLEDQINNFITEVREKDSTDLSRKISSSSEELMDTSD